jgi:hypothetical protein
LSLRLYKDKLMARKKNFKKKANYKPIFFLVLLLVLISFSILLFNYLLISANPIFLTQSVKGASSTPTCTDTSQIDGKIAYFRCLKNQFNITIKGTSDWNKGKIFYNDFAIPFSYQAYLSLFKYNGITIKVKSQHDHNGAWAETDPEGKIIILYNAFFTDASSRYQKYILIHESAHAVGDNFDYLQQDLYSWVYDAKKDSKCFKSGVIKTFPTHLLSGDKTRTRRVHENFAEAVSDTIMLDAKLCNDETCPSNGGGGEKIKDFANTCYNTYSYVRNRILGSEYGQ